MNYRVASVGVVPANVSELELRYLLALRAGVHGLKSEAARCLQAMSSVRLENPLPQRCYEDYLTEELVQARRSPEFIRRALLEQILLSKCAISSLMVRLEHADSSEAANAYSAGIARLQAEHRRNLKCLGELPFDENYVEPTKNVCSGDELVGQLLQPLDSDRSDIDFTGNENNDVDTEKGSNSTTRTDGREAEEPATGRCGQTQPDSAPRPHRYRPTEAQGGDYAAQAVAQDQRPENASGQSPGRKKRLPRQGHVREVAQTGAPVRGGSRREHAGVEETHAGLVI